MTWTVHKRHVSGVREGGGKGGSEGGGGGKKNMQR